MATLAEIRAQYPQYDDLSDEELAGAMHRKFYSDMPFDAFAKRIGIGGPKPSRATDEMSGTDRFTAGIGYGALSTNDALGQIGARVLGGSDGPGSTLENAAFSAIPGIGQLRTLIRGLTTPDQRGAVRGAIDQNAADRRATYDADLGQTGHGLAGNVTGAVLSSLPLGGLSVAAPRAAAAVAPATRMAALREIARPALAAGGTGAAQSMLTNPVTDPNANFLGQKALQGGVGLGAGAVVNTALRGAGRVLEEILPSNLTARVVNAASGSARRTPHAAEGEALARRTGVELTPAAVTGGKTHMMAENMARQSMFSRDLAFDADEKISRQVVDYVNNVAGRISARADDSASVGQRVAGTVAREVDRLAARRTEIGGRLYGEVDDLARGAPFFEAKTLRGELERVIAENRGVVAADAKKITQWATQQLDALGNAGQGTGLRKLIANRRFWSQAAAGKANLFENASPGAERRIAAQMLGAIDQDLDTAAQTVGGPIGQKLQQANATWRAYSQAIEGVEASPLGRIMGEEFSAAAMRPGGTFSSVPPEAWVQRIKKLEPSQVTLVRDFMARKNPDAWQAVKRRVLEDALEAGQNAAPSEGARALAIRGNAFVNAMAKTPKDQARLRAMYSPRELREIDDAFNVIRRWGDTTGKNFSGTAPAAEALGLMNTLKDVALKGSASAAGQVLGVRSVARLMNDQGGRAALLQLQRLPPQSAQARQLMSYLAAVLASEQMEGVDSGQQQGGGP